MLLLTCSVGLYHFRHVVRSVLPSTKLNSDPSYC